MEENESELDPRIKIELEKLNTTTDEINKLEIECDEANTTFRMLLNESTRRLKLLNKKLGSCIEKARPYYEILDVHKKAQIECQEAAVLYQKANGIHAAAKETVALAEQRFLTHQHEWQFDNAWQEMLNHATMKVMEAETQKAETSREHQRRAEIFQEIDEKMKSVEEKQQKAIIRARPYFDEKILCQEQLNTQKQRIEALKQEIIKTKAYYSDTLKNLEEISNEIHRKRESAIVKKLEDENELLKKPREPGVGAEIKTTFTENNSDLHYASLPDIQQELDNCELNSFTSELNSLESHPEDAVSTNETNEPDEEIIRKFKTELCVTLRNSAEGQSCNDIIKEG